MRVCGTGEEDAVAMFEGSAVLGLAEFHMLFITVMPPLCLTLVPFGGG